MIEKLGLGFMRQDKNNFQQIQDLIDYSMSQKLNYFETCYFYLGNECEELVTKALSKYPRESYELCAKMPVKIILERSKDPEEIFLNQLKKHNTDYFDVYLLQALDDTTIKILSETKVISYLLKQKKLGKIKKLGFSFHGSYNHLDFLLKLECWDLVQIQFNYYDYYLGYAQEFYNLILEHNLPIYVMGPTKGGTLINQLPNSVIELLGEDYKFLPYKFLLSFPGVEKILTGAVTIEQLSENIEYFKNFEKSLSELDFEKIKNAMEVYKKEKFICCTYCGYCQPCPQDIEIPRLFYRYNHDIILNKEKNNKYENFLLMMKETNPAAKCIQCFECSKKCPQKLNIPKILFENLFPMRF